MILWIIPTLIVLFLALALLDLLARNLLHLIIDCEVLILLITIAVCDLLTAA